MTNIQMLLALGAMILLTILLLNVNKNSLYTEDVMYDSNFGITATSIASSIIEDASKKRFDQVFYTGDSVVTDANSFTPANALGIETGEDISNVLTFNDFDDYNNYSAVDSTMPSARFNINCKVVYVDIINPNQTKGTPSFHKKITVKVWSESMKDTMLMSSIFSYWTD